MFRPQVLTDHNQETNGYAMRPALIKRSRTARAAIPSTSRRSPRALRPPGRAHSATPGLRQIPAQSGHPAHRPRGGRTRAGAAPRAAAAGCPRTGPPGTGRARAAPRPRCRSARTRAACWAECAPTGGRRVSGPARTRRSREMLGLTWRTAPAEAKISPRACAETGCFRPPTQTDVL